MQLCFTISQVPGKYLTTADTLSQAASLFSDKQLSQEVTA